MPGCGEGAGIPQKRGGGSTGLDGRGTGDCLSDTEGYGLKCLVKQVEEPIKPCRGLFSCIKKCIVPAFHGSNRSRTRNLTALVVISTGDSPLPKKCQLPDSAERTVNSFSGNISMQCIKKVFNPPGSGACFIV